MRRGIERGSSSPEVDRGQLEAAAEQSDTENIPRGDRLSPAATQGSVSDLDLSVDIIVGAFTEVTQSWIVFGLSYDNETVRQIFQIPLEDQMFDDLRGLARYVVDHGDSYAIQALSTLSYRLMMEAFEYD